MKVNELLKILKADGWYLHRNGKGQIPVPRHQSKEVATGTLNKILEDAGLK